MADIKVLRKNLNLSQKELAEKLRVPTQLVKRWERKEAKISLAMLRKVVRIERRNDGN